MPWEPYKLGVKRFTFTDPGNAGSSAKDISDNFVRLTDLVEAAGDGSIDLLAYQRIDQRDAPGGYPSLNVIGRIATAVIPGLPIGHIAGLTSALAARATLTQLGHETSTLNGLLVELEGRVEAIENVTHPDRTQLVHVQSTPAAAWYINHDLARYPQVTVINSFNEEVVGDVRYPAEDRIVIEFSGAFSGRAILT